jgi:hypothetical protein
MRFFLIAAGLLVLTAPVAVAIEIDNAIRMCAEHPTCTHGEKDAGGSLTLYVSGGANHRISIHCPQAGECVRIRRSGPYRGVSVDEVEGMLALPAPQTVPPGAIWNRSGR